MSSRGRTPAPGMNHADLLLRGRPWGSATFVSNGTRRPRRARARTCRPRLASRRVPGRNSRLPPDHDLVDERQRWLDHARAVVESGPAWPCDGSSAAVAGFRAEGARASRRRGFGAPATACAAVEPPSRSGVEPNATVVRSRPMLVPGARRGSEVLVTGGGLAAF